MKKIIVSTIKIYQIFISTFIKQGLGIKNSCRFHPTCSDYAKTSIREKGIVKGSYLSVLRLLKCQPFYKGALV